MEVTASADVVFTNPMVDAAESEPSDSGLLWAPLGDCGETPKEIAARQKKAHAPDALELKLLEYNELAKTMCAELKQAAEAAKLDDEHGRRVKALMKDCMVETERLSETFQVLAEEEDHHLTLSFGMTKRKLRERWANTTETLVELWNEVSDVLMIRQLLVENFYVLFAVSLVSMVLNLLVRIWLAWKQRAEIDPGKEKKYLYGALVYMVEPNLGQRLMKKALKDKEEGGLVYVFGHGFWDNSGNSGYPGGYVHMDKDAVAVKARNDQIAGQTQVQTTVLMLTTEDLVEFVVQVSYLILKGGQDLDAT
eukprot:COSAG06_NODE_2062_length_7696_cov_1217.164407_6_plen_308_part_00